MSQPYYDRAGITIYHGRCQDVLPELSPVDLVLTDPPYTEATHAGARTAARQVGDYHKKDPGKLIAFDSFTEAEQRACFDLIGPLAQSWVISFMDWRHITALEQVPPSGLRFVRFGVWVKTNGAPQFTGDRPAMGWEGIAILHRLGGKMVWNGGGGPSTWFAADAPAPVWVQKIEHQTTRLAAHPTAKPHALIAQLITLFSQPGDLVLDPFMGSGVMLYQAKRLGRRAIGIETDERWCERAARCMEQEAMLFEVPA